MLSKKTIYAMKALVALAKKQDEGPVMISRVAEDEHIPKKFLELILLELRNAGILYSKKGAKGGYLLAKDPAEIKLSQVLRVTGGPIALLPCVSLNFYQPCDEFEDAETSGIVDTFVKVREASLQILSETSIADVMERERILKAGQKKVKPEALKSKTPEVAETKVKAKSNGKIAPKIAKKKPKS
ncbi:transcriptional regulator, BadM/Rrf2 family [bacterium A37T11]|nr:transcriptional regulator, BadM/Rrf2 family [bacterium A37T11]